MNQTNSRTHTHTNSRVNVFRILFISLILILLLLVNGNRSPALVFPSPMFFYAFSSPQQIWKSTLSCRNIRYLSATAVHSPQILLMSRIEVWRIFIAVAWPVTTAAAAATGISSINTARRYQRSKQVKLYNVNLILTCRRSSRKPLIYLQQNKMADQQQYFLKWNDYQSNMVSSFKHLRNEKSFTDVTLACEGQTCKAHKMVLSACSPYFKALLEVNIAIGYYYVY